MKQKWQMTVVFLCTLLLLVSSAMADGQLRIVAQDELIEPGEEFGVYLLMEGDGTYDVYAALMGGVLGAELFLFNESGDIVPISPDGTIPKLRSNLDLGAASMDDKIIQLLPKLPSLGGIGIEGTYSFLGALCTPGQLDLPVLETINIEIQ